MSPLVLWAISIFLFVPSIFCVSAAANDYDKIASEITRAANRNGKKRIAVLPFQNVASHNGTSGTVISERLTGHMLDRGGLEVIERTLLQGILQEQRLGYSGILNPHTIRELGKVLGVDAVVTGTLVELNNGRIEINARMIDAENAKVLCVAPAKVDKDWSESAFDNFDPFNVPIPPLSLFEGAAYAAAPRVADSLNEPNPECTRAMHRHDDLERSLVDLKARYWVLKLRDPNFSQESLTRNPGSEIRDADTRETFYSSLRQYYEQPAVPQLTAEETRRLNDYETKSQALSDSCGETF